MDDDVVLFRRGLGLHGRRRRLIVHRSLGDGVGGIFNRGSPVYPSVAEGNSDTRVCVCQRLDGGSKTGARHRTRRRARGNAARAGLRGDDPRGRDPAAARRPARPNHHLRGRETRSSHLVCSPLPLPPQGPTPGDDATCATTKGSDGSHYAREMRVHASIRPRLACAGRAARAVVKRRGLILEF